MRKKRKKSRSLEHIFFKDNEYLLRKYPYFNKYFTNKQFNLIQENIIIRGLRNKETIDEAIKTYKQVCFEQNKKPSESEIKNVVSDAIKDLPYINDINNHRIYIPFFSIALNTIYVDEPYRLLSYPYCNLLDDLSCMIDPFETYGWNIYDSYFSKMIRGINDKTSCTFFDVDDYLIYVINSQGRLDQIIPIFDRYMAHFDMTCIMNRVNNVMRQFYAGNKMEFINELYRQNFISDFTYRYIKNKGDIK